MMLEIQTARGAWELTMPETDEQLFHRWRRGDSDSFTELVERYRGPLFGVVLRMVRDRSEAEDIFQETFFRVLKHEARFDSDRKFSTWIYTIATNLCRDLSRRRGRSLITCVEELPEPECPRAGEDEMFAREVREALTDALAGLPVEQREVFSLREFAGLSFREIADVTDSNLNTVLGRMHTAVKKLRTELAGLWEVE